LRLAPEAHRLDRPNNTVLDHHLLLKTSKILTFLWAKLGLFVLAVFLV